MDLSSWLKEFRAVHAEAKRGTLTGQGLADYLLARDELARALLAAQHIVVGAGESPRRALRASRALQVDIAFFDGTVRVATRYVCASGFSALLAHRPKVGEDVKVVLRIPGGEPLHAEARAALVEPQAGNALVTFKWVGLTEAEAERLEMFVFDAVLEQLQA
jgi:hypothetical protein